MGSAGLDIQFLFFRGAGAGRPAFCGKYLASIAGSLEYTNQGIN